MKISLITIVLCLVFINTSLFSEPVSNNLASSDLGTGSDPNKPLLHEIGFSTIPYGVIAENQPSFTYYFTYYMDFVNYDNWVVGPQLLISAQPFKTPYSSSAFPYPDQSYWMSNYSYDCRLLLLAGRRFTYFNVLSTDLRAFLGIDFLDSDGSYYCPYITPQSNSFSSSTFRFDGGIYIPTRFYFGRFIPVSWLQPLTMALSSYFPINNLIMNDLFSPTDSVMYALENYQIILEITYAW